MDLLLVGEIDQLKWLRMQCPLTTHACSSYVENLKGAGWLYLATSCTQNP